MNSSENTELSNIAYLPNVSRNIEDVLEFNRTNHWPDVTAQAKVFIHEYAIAGNLPDACNRAGVSRPEGSRLLRDPIIGAYLEHIQADLLSNTIITRQFLELEMLQTLDEVSGRVDVPNVTKEGDIVMAPRYNGSAKIGLLRMMMPLAGMNKEQGVDGHGVTVQVNVAAAGYDPSFDRTVVVEVPNGGDNLTE